MTDTLTVLAPGQPWTSVRGRSLVLVDDQWYAEELFEKAAAQVEAGPGVERVDRDGKGGFILAQSHRDELNAIRTCDAHVLLFVSTDTDVKTLMSVARKCPGATFIVHPTTDQSAVEALTDGGIPFELYRDFKPGRGKADLALLTNDWGFERRAFLAGCRRHGIRTVCLQEAANVDFDGPPHRMRWADIALLQGPHALAYLHRDNCMLTGNPRFDDFEPLPIPEKPVVLINCNFIFGFAFLELARRWTEEVVHAVESLGLPYRITVHPRDETDLRGIEHVQSSGAYKVRDQLAQCSVLVSRDSSLPYEALRLNRRAVYYDPFGEKERCLREDDTGFIEKCVTPGELRACLEKVIRKPPPEHAREQFDRASQYLCTSGDGHCDLRVIRALHTIASHPRLYTGSDALKQASTIIVLNRFLHVSLRPRLRKITWLRALWRAAKRLRMKSSRF